MNLIKKMIVINLFALISSIHGVENDQAYKKMRDLSVELRCMVCQNQSLFESDSELANDLKSVIYEKFKNGDNKKEIKSYLVERYGEFILFKPVFNFYNLILWLAPILSFLVISLIALRKLSFKEKNR